MLQKKQLPPWANDVLIYAHRGYSAKYPENTLSAFRAALPYVDGIELDVQVTKDHHLVVIHDETVDRTTNGTGYIKDMTLEQVKLLRIEQDETIPTLDEVLELIQPYNITLNIELKTDRFDYIGIEAQTWSTVKAFRLTERVVFSSFNPHTLLRMREVAPTARLGILIVEDHPDLIAFSTQIQAEAVHAPPSFINTLTWKAVRERGMLTRLYTINEMNEMPTDTTEIESIMTDEVELFATHQ